MEWDDEFLTFLREYKEISIAIGFIMGAAANDMVKAFVTNIFTPFITPLIPESSWQAATVSLGPVTLNWGAFLASVINFLILALAVFLIIKKLLAPALEGNG
ncbi:MAG: MscL family protein [Halobacteriaceae archaeon]